MDSAAIRLHVRERIAAGNGKPPAGDKYPVNPDADEPPRTAEPRPGKASRQTEADEPPRAQTPPRVAPYQAFPVDALPAPLDEFVRQGAAALGCDPAYVALPALAVFASTIGNTRAIRLKRGWTEPPILWTAIIADSGTLKSPAFDVATDPLFVVQKRLSDEHGQALNAYERDLDAHKETKRKAPARSGEAAEPPPRPIMQRVVCGDTTVEKLAELLQDNARGLLVARDELNGWFASFTRYKRQATSDLPAWLEMHRAGKLIVDRKTGERPTLFVSRASVSVTGGVQPRVLARAMTADHFDAGFAGRLLMAMPPKMPKRWTELEIHPDVEREYAEVIDRLLSLDFHAGDKGEAAPRVLDLSPDAKKTWIRFYDAWAQEQAAVEGELAAAYAKLEAYAARFALVYHVTHRAFSLRDDGAPIERESIEAGIALCRWFAHETRRVYAMIAESESESETRRLVEFIRGRNGTITVKDLQRASRKYPTSGEALAALDGLVSTGLAEWRERPGSAKGGRPTCDCILTAPSADETDETH